MQPDAQELPQTTQIFDAPALVINAHDWIQQGYFIMDNCRPKKPDCHPGGIAIPYSKMLVKNQRGEYDLVDEMSS